MPRSAHSQQTQLGNTTEEGFTSQLRRTTLHQTWKKGASSQVCQATPQNIEQIPSFLGHEFTWSSSPQNSFIFNLFVKKLGMCGEDDVHASFENLETNALAGNSIVYDNRPSQTHDYVLIDQFRALEMLTKSSRIRNHSGPSRNKQRQELIQLSTGLIQKKTHTPS